MDVAGSVALDTGANRRLGVSLGASLLERGSAKVYVGARDVVYCAAEAASWSLTNAIRQELRGQGTQVAALHVGFMDTAMTAGLDVRSRRPTTWPCR